MTQSRVPLAAAVFAAMALASPASAGGVGPSLERVLQGVEATPSPRPAGEYLSSPGGGRYLLALSVSAAADGSAVIESRLMGRSAWLAVPARDTGRFAAALVRAGDWCSALEDGRAEGGREVDGWDAEAAPPPGSGHGSRTRPVSLRVAVRSVEGGKHCFVEIAAAGFGPFRAFLPRQDAARIAGAVNAADDAARALRAEQRRQRAVFEALE